MLKKRLLVIMVTGILTVLTVSETSAQVESLTVQVDGLACPFCAYGIEKKLKKVEGVQEIIINMQEGTVSLVTKAGESINFSQVPAAIRDSGFTPRDIQVSSSGILEKTGEHLRLNLDGQSPLLIDVKGKKREKLLSLAQKGGPVQVTGSIIEQETGIWTIVPKEIVEVTP